jgi:hypothetical protein
MNMKNSLSISAQSPFSIDNFRNNETLDLSPSLFYKKISGGVEFIPFDNFPASTSGMLCSTHVVQNEHQLTVGYVETPLTLKMKGTSINCEFDIVRVGNKVVYTPTTAIGMIDPVPILYDDIVGGALLRVYASPQDSGNANQLQVVNDVHHVVVHDRRTQPGPKGRGSNQKTIPDNEAFSFLTTVSLYFSGTIHQYVNSAWTLVDTLYSEAFGSFGGYFCVTGDENNLYPNGVSRLQMTDGFSEGNATIEFDHNTVDKTVTITITASPGTLCDIRDLTEMIGAFPNTICFAP